MSSTHDNFKSNIIVEKMQTIEEEKNEVPKTPNKDMHVEVEQALIDLTECKNNYWKDKNDMISTITGFKS